MSKRVSCPWGCGKRVKSTSSHKRFCTAVNGAVQSAESVAGDSAVQVAEQKSVTEQDTQKGMVLGEEAQSFEETESLLRGIREKIKVSDGEMSPKTVQKTEIAGQSAGQVVDGAQVVMSQGYVDIANEFHRTLSKVVLWVTKKPISSEEVERLNRCGASILAKHDKNRKVEQYSPEIAYGWALLDIAGGIALALQNQKEVKNGGAKDGSGTVGGERPTNQGVERAS